MPSRVLAFLRDGVREGVRKIFAPEPPPIVKAAPGAYALFYDEDERDLLYAKPWPYVGVPVDDRTNRSEWKIEGHLFTPSHRMPNGDWIFRRTLLWACTLVLGCATVASAENGVTFPIQRNVVAHAAAQTTPLINAANILVRTDANGYVIVADQTYTAPDGPLRVFANTLVRTDANGYLIVTNPTGLGGAPIAAEYWVGAAHATLTAEKNLGALSTGLVLNTSGTPSAYAGTSCTSQFPRSLDASGAATCASVALAADVSGDLPYANFTQAGAASRLLGRGSASGAGDWEDITLGSGLSMSGTTLSATGTIDHAATMSRISLGF